MPSAREIGFKMAADEVLSRCCAVQAAAGPAVSRHAAEVEAGDDELFERDLAFLLPNAVESGEILSVAFRGAFGVEH